jgi:hypothetical protein
MVEKGLMAEDGLCADYRSGRPTPRESQGRKAQR